MITVFLDMNIKISLLLFF